MTLPKLRSLIATGSGRATLAFGAIFTIWLTWELIGDAPVTLNTLVGGFGGVWFGVIANERARKDEAVAAKAEDASQRADAAEQKAVAAERRAAASDDCGEPADG